MRSRWRRAAFAGGLVTLVAAAVVLWPTALGGQTAYVTTHGSSMEPSFHDGDLAVVRVADRYRVGDVVAYRSPALDTVVLHRIIDRRDDRYVFKGDNNSWVDRDKPAARDLVGKLWVRVPRLGVVLDGVRDGLPFIAGAFALLAVGGTSVMRRRRRARATAGTGEIARAEEGGGRTAAGYRNASLALALIALVSLALGAYAWTRPTEERVIGSTPYEERGRFAYSAPAPSGPVYADGTVDTGDPVYLNLVTAIDVRFDYQVEAPAELRWTGGTIELQADLADTTGWKHSLSLRAPAEFTGAEASVTGRLDAGAIRRVIAEVQRATGTNGGTHTVTVVPHVHLDGTLDSKPVTSDFRPSLVFQLDSTALRLAAPADGSAGARAPSRRATVTKPGVVAGRVDVFGLELPVQPVRLAAVAVALLAALGAWLAWVLSRRHARTEVERIALRYGRRLVPATNATHITQTPIVDLRSMEDLARIAEHNDVLIIHRATPHGHVYVCFGEVATYRYILDGPPVPTPVRVAAWPVTGEQVPPPPARHHPRRDDRHGTLRGSRLSR